MALRLKWDRTWPDTLRDFTARDPVTHQYVGRIYWRDSGSSGSEAWAWFGRNQFGRGTSGSELTKQAAAEELESAWFGG